MARQHNLENIGCIAQRVKEVPAWRRLQWSDARQVPEHVVDNFSGDNAGCGKSFRAKLQHGIDLVEVPGKTGAQCDGALELRNISFVRSLRTDVRVESQHD